MRRADHAVLDLKRRAFVCLHCGVEQVFLMPIEVTKAAAEATEFAAAHADCKPKEQRHG